MAVSMVRQVWYVNLMEELNMISHCFGFARYVSIDTEFPGTFWKPEQPVSTMFLHDHYRLMKKNVDSTKIIQLGLTHSCSNFRCTWGFNFREFNRDHDIHDPESIALLEKQGIDLWRNKHNGVDATAFGGMFPWLHGLMGPQRNDRIWITFHGLYDLGYLIKLFMRRPLPDDPRVFMSLVRQYFGGSVYDLKAIAHGMKLCGGLDKVAKSLGFERAAAAKRHQAGSDSLLIMDVFIRLVFNAPSVSPAYIFMRYAFLVYGITWLP